MIRGINKVGERASPLKISLICGLENLNI